jgi:hypothetical protein
MGEAKAAKRWEGLKQVARKPLERRIVPVEVVANRPSKPIHGVIAPVQDPVVRGQAVVVELIPAVVQALSPSPPDGPALRLVQRLADEGVVVHRNHVPSYPSEQRRKCVRREDHSLCPD